MKFSMRREIGLYGAALVLAWLLRFAFLGRAPLSEAEATLALQALGLARGQEMLLGPHPAYLLFSGAWMFLFGSGNAVARFWPALMGGLVALAPVFFRVQLGRRPALLLALFLAIDPGLVALSRQAGSQSLAVTFLLLALGLWLARRPAWAGAMAGLALLSGPQIWPGLLALGIALWAAGPCDLPVQGPAAIDERPIWRTALWALLAVLLLAGTLFFVFPRGLSAMAASLPAYLAVWTTSSGLSLGLVLAALLFYAFLPVVFGLTGLLVGRRLELHRFLGAWALVALALALLPPGRTMEGLLWVVVPLWALTARQVDAYMRVPSGSRLTVIGQAVLATAILIFVSFDLQTISNSITAQQDYAPEMIALVGALVLLLATSLLVAWGWNGRSAGYGVLWSLMVILFVFTLSATWNASGLSGRGTAELWQTGPQFVDENLLTDTLQEFENWNINTTYPIDTAVVGVPSPALQWALRNTANVSYVDFLPATAAPAVVITPDQPELALSATYRGQNFVLGQQPTWYLILPYEWLRWLYYREAPLEKQPIILWARTDLFPESDLLSEESPPSQDGSGIE